MKDWRVKQKMLIYLSPSHGHIYNQIKLFFAHKIDKNIDEMLIKKYLEDMINEGYVEAVKDPKGFLVYKLTTNGYFFLNQSGGYKRNQVIKIMSMIWTMAKIIAITINACAILYISILTYKATDKANDNKEERDRLNSVIDSLINVVTVDTIRPTR